jgi:hypothetical protein
MEYLTFNFGFCIRSSTNEFPCVQILLNQLPIVNEVSLVQAGSVDDPTADMQWVNVKTQVADDIEAIHTIKVQALNIDDTKKIHGDFGFQVRVIHINGVPMEHFSRNGTVFNPIYCSGYMDNFLKPTKRLHEIEYLNNQPYHVERGDYANYVNSKAGWWEMSFSTPLYNWIAVDNKFGAMHKWLIR